MLVLTRKVGEKITIGENIEIQIIECKGGVTKIGIKAPRAINIVRNELLTNSGRHSSIDK